MTEVRPFRGLRYDPAVVADWGAQLAPPYDVVSAEQKAALQESGAYQISHLESATGTDEATAAAALLRSWRDGGVLRHDEHPSFYLDEHRFELAGAPRTRQCLFAAVRLVPWSDGVVLPHEGTMSGPKAQRRRLREMLHADISPLMVLVRDGQSRIAGLLATAASTAVAVEGHDPSGDAHALRLIDDPAATAALSDAFTTERLYIADGHHRYESALLVRDALASRAGAHWSGDEGANFVLMGIVRAGDPGLEVGPTHRIVTRPLPPDALSRLSDLFDLVDAGPAEDGPGALLERMTADAERLTIGAVGLEPGRLLLLQPKPDARAALPASVPAAWHAMDVALLQYLILAPLFGIDDEALRGGEAVAYTHYADEAFAAATSNAASAAFLLNAPSLESIFAAAEAGERMPQKSTYFVPKLPTGVVLHPLD